MELRPLAASNERLPASQVPLGASISELALRPDAQLPQLGRTNGNRLQLLVDEHAVLPSMLESVRGARDHIQLSMFALTDSGAGAQLIDAMSERARAGVKVQVTLDQVGSMIGPIGPGASMVRRMRDSGIEVAVNDRINASGVQAVDHRKLLVVDGTTAYTGGMNFSGKFGKWHDVMMRVDGPAAAHLGAHFVDRWVDLEPGSVIRPSDLPSTSLADAAGGAALIVNHPGKELQASEHLLRQLESATKQAWIMTPTLSDPEVVAAMTGAARRGVDVRVAVSGPEGWIGTRALRLVGATFYRELVDAGVRVYEQPGMSHAKISLIDGVASVGSLNMTRRATKFDHELMLASDDASLVSQVTDLFDTDFARSDEVTAEEARGLPLRIGERVRKLTGLRW